MVVGPFAVHIPQPYTPWGLNVSSATNPRKRPLSTSPASLNDLLIQSRPSAVNHASMPKKSRKADEVKSSNKAVGAASATGAMDVIPAAPDTRKEGVKFTPKFQPPAKSTSLEPTLGPEPSAVNHSLSTKPEVPGFPGTLGTMGGPECS